MRWFWFTDLSNGSNCINTKKDTCIKFLRRFSLSFFSVVSAISLLTFMHDLDPWLTGQLSLFLIRILLVQIDYRVQILTTNERNTQIFTCNDPNSRMLLNRDFTSLLCNNLANWFCYYQVYYFGNYEKVKFFQTDFFFFHKFTECVDIINIWYSFGKYFFSILSKND